VCPAYVVENKDEAALISDDENPVQAVFIDFAHAVDINHPQATALLERDVDQVRKFFVKKGITTLGRKMAMEFVTSPYPDGVDGDVKVDEPLVDEGMASSANDSTSQPSVAVAGREPVSMITFNSSSTNASQFLDQVFLEKLVKALSNNRFERSAQPASRQSRACLLYRPAKIKSLWALS
jgi:serine/threonine-protein kinase RIO1